VAKASRWQRQVVPKPLAIEFEGETLNVVYNARLITPRWRQQFTERVEDPFGNAKLLAEALISWDMEDDHGQPYPPTVANLVDFPEEVIDAISSEILEDILTRARAEGNSSDDGSPPTASSESGLNGTSSSSPPASTPAPLTS
jgi:hypothetical protein